MARPAAHILVSIVNWNSSESLNECLKGITYLAKDDQPDVMVVDNHSTQDSLKIESSTKKMLRSLEITKNDSNLGFAGGHNINIRKAKLEGYDYVVLLNPDTEVIDPNIFFTLSDALDTNLKALGANPTILRSVDPNIVWYGGGELSLKTSYASHLRVGLDADVIPDKVQSVSLLTGGCLAIALKRADIDQLLLSEDYFLYWEDTDWCARAARAGFELLYVPKARLLHHVSSSLGIRSPTYIYYNIRNHYQFIRKNLKPLYWPLAWISVGIIIAKYKYNIFFRYKSGRWPALKALLGGMWDGWLGRTGRARFSHE